MIFWTLTIGISVSLLVITAAAKASMPHMAYAHMLIAAAVSITFALVAIREMRSMSEGAASEAALGAATARFSGVVWTWGALGLLATYSVGIMYWNEWWHFFLAFAAAAVLSLGFARMLQRDADAGKQDEAILKLSRYAGILQLVGMIIVVLGLLIDGKMVRFLVPRHTDWAGNNIFFFGALALAAISAYSLRLNKPKQQQA